MSEPSTPSDPDDRELKREMSAFCAALYAGDAAGVRRSLETSTLVRERVNAPLFDFGQRAAHVAAKNIAVLDVLLEFGADLNLRSEWEKGPFTVLDNTNEESARYLLGRGATLTPHAAARLGWLDDLRRLVEADPSVAHERGGDGVQPLHEAATVAIADYLVDRGAGIDVRCIDHGSTPAQYALAHRPEVCRRLLERGATPDIFMAARLGDMALTERVLREAPDAVAAMVNEPGYDPVPPFNIYCWTLGFEMTPHLVARQYGHEDVYQLLFRRSPDAVKLVDAAARADEPAARALLARNPGLVTALPPRRHSLLARAIFHGHFDAANLMLRLGFDPVAGGVDGGSALHAAAWMGHIGLVEQLLARAAVPVQLREPTHGSTPLGWAVFGAAHRRAKDGDYLGVIDRLVAAGADVKGAGNKINETYVDLAEGNPEVQEALRRHGAA